jgi:hypothetical protein
MTNSESLHQFGSNAYAKPAAALTILRETILGRELFDFAFKEYANRWMFKRPMPADFFRTMEDASAVDLDWFWHGWFYTNEHVDLAVEKVRIINLDSQNPYIEKPKQQQKLASEPRSLLNERNDPIEKRTDRFPNLLDFYNQYDPLEVTEADREAFEKMIESLSEEDRELLTNLPHVIAVDFRNVGGVVMPLIVELEFEDGSREVQYIPAEIWRINNEHVSKMFITEKRVVKVRLDPRFETADVSAENNVYPPDLSSENVEFSPAGGPQRGGRRGGGSNPMREALKSQTKPDETKAVEEKQESTAGGN